MSLRAIYRECALAVERLIAESNRATTLAWQTAAFQRMRKLPTLQDVLHKPAATLEQQFTQTMHNLSVVTGRDVTRVRKVRVNGGGWRLTSLKSSAS